MKKFGVGAVLLQRLFFDYVVQILRGDRLISPRFESFFPPNRNLLHYLP